VLLKTGIISDIGTMSLIVTICGVVGALLMYWGLRRTPLWFLYRRPHRLHLDRPRPAPAPQPAE
jgi:hypothetical protein